MWLVFSIGYIVKINLFNNSSIRPKYIPINVLFQNKKLFQNIVVFSGTLNGQNSIMWLYALNRSATTNSSNLH